MFGHRVSGVMNVDEEAHVESGLAASTSGRVDLAFWDVGRKRRRPSAWSSPTGVLYFVNVCGLLLLLCRGLLPID